MYPQRFQTTSGEEFDRGSWKKPLLPHPQFGWKAECSCSKCYEAGQPPQPALASKTQKQYLLPRLFRAGPVKDHYIQM
jgi:hypothetical protein